MTILELSTSEMSTIVRALTLDDTPASVGALRELERQGVFLPVWVGRRVEEHDRKWARRSAAASLAATMQGSSPRDITD